MRPLKVLHVGHSYVVRLNRSVSAALARMDGVQLTVGAPAFFHGDLRPLALEPEPSPPPYALRPLPTRLSQRIHVFWYRRRELFELVRGGSFDIVYAWEEPYIYAGYEIAQAVGPTRARFCFRTAQSLVKWYPPPFSSFERHVRARAQAWVAGGELVREAMLKRGFPAATGRVMPLAVDMEAFQPLPSAQREQVRVELGLTGPVVGFIGRLVPEKGLSVLLAALEKVTSPWSLVLLGSGPLKGHVEQWAAQRGWERRVRVVLAPHSEVPRYLGAFDVLAAPSQTTRRWREQFGRMVIEAFACRVPVVASDSGELPYVVGDAGRVVAEADASAWASALGELLETPSLREKLAEAGYQRAKERFSSEAVARQRLALYRELMESPVGGTSSS